MDRSIFARTGPRHPIRGTDFAGVVEAVGPGDAPWRPGDAVFGEALGTAGSFAEDTVAAADSIAAIPAGVTFQQAAATPLAATTALRCFRAGRAEPGQRVLINGASGGVGTFAIQLALAGGCVRGGLRCADRCPGQGGGQLCAQRGRLYLITFISMPTLALYQNVRTQRDFVWSWRSHRRPPGRGQRGDRRAGPRGTAVVLFPVLKRQNETAALGFVAARVMEASLILVGVVSVLTLITLRADTVGPGPEPAAALALGHTLGAVYDCTFLLSQNLMPVVNAICLGSVLYRTGLVPRILPAIGLIGAPLRLVSDIAIFFGLYDRMAPVAALAAIPIAAWEFSLGIHLTVKGFRPEAVVALTAADGR